MQYNKNIIFITMLFVLITITGCSGNIPPVTKQTALVENITDSPYNTLADNDIAEIDKLIHSVTAIMNNTDKRLLHDNADKIMTDFNTDDMNYFLELNNVVSSLIEYRLLQLHMNSITDGKMLTGIKIRYSSNELDDGEYWFVANVSIRRTAGYWVCTGYELLGYANTATHILSWNERSNSFVFEEVY